MCAVAGDDGDPGSAVTHVSNRRRPLCARLRPARRRRHCDTRVDECSDGVAQIVGEQFEIRERVISALRPNRARRRSSSPRCRGPCGGERHQRVDRPHVPAQQVERELGPGDIGHDHIEEALARLQARRQRYERRRGEAGQLNQASGHRPPARSASCPPSPRRSQPGAQPVVDPDRQRRPHRRDPVAKRAALARLANRDRHQRLEHTSSVSNSWRRM